jgi:hypothetical protein
MPGRMGVQCFVGSCPVLVRPSSSRVLLCVRAHALPTSARTVWRPALVLVTHTQRRSGAHAGAQSCVPQAVELHARPHCAVCVTREQALPDTRCKPAPLVLRPLPTNPRQAAWGLSLLLPPCVHQCPATPARPRSTHRTVLQPLSTACAPRFCAIDLSVSPARNV